MLGALEKFLANKAGQIGSLKKMPLGQLIEMLGEKGQTFGASTLGVMKKHPGESAALAGLGGVAGASLSGEDEQEEDPDAELLKKYGLR